MTGRHGKVLGMTTAAVRLTHHDVAGRLNMSVSGVSRIRSGDRQPSWATVRAIIREFELDDKTALAAYNAFDAGGRTQVEFLESLWG